MRWPRPLDPDPERLLALESFCRSCGVPGLWTPDGPTERAQLHVRRRHLETIDQEFAVALAFRAWRTEGPCPDAIVVLALAPETLAALLVLCDRWNGRPPRRGR